MRRALITLLFSLSVISPALASELKLDGFGAKKIGEINNLLASLEPLIEKRRREATLATLRFEELYSVLNEEEAVLLKNFQDLKGDDLGTTLPFRGIATGEEALVRIEDQKIKVEGKDFIIPPQYLPEDVHKKYLAMMEVMEKDLGKRLYIESGYRSSAYQLYLFIFYLKNHDHSIMDTLSWVALPGYSEHGSPQHQAIDFINEDGINGETNPADFEALKEYRWLQINAGHFGFKESYPKRNELITYEPWHWRNVEPLPQTS